MIKSIDWGYWLSRLILLTAGATIAAFAVALFYIPSDFAPSGLSGIGVILNELFGISVGLFIVIANIPVQLIAYWVLKRNKRLLLETTYTVIVYSVALDVVAPLISINGVSDDVLLNALFGGILMGIGSGLVYRAGGSMGGTSTLAKVLRSKFGLSISVSSIYTDTMIIIASGVVFGWESALYATVALFIGRASSDYILEGTSDTNTALIISKYPQEMIEAVGDGLQRGITRLDGHGRFGNERAVLIVTISRSEVNALRKIIQLVDQDAFVSVLQGYRTFGRGFQSVHPTLPLKLDHVDDDKADAIKTQQIQQVKQSA